MVTIYFFRSLKRWKFNTEKQQQHTFHSEVWMYKYHMLDIIHLAYLRHSSVLLDFDGWFFWLEITVSFRMSMSTPLTLFHAKDNEA